MAAVNTFDDTLKAQIKIIDISTVKNFANSRYEIRELLGEGGMGRVYSAYDTKLDMEVAIKVLPSNIAYDPMGIEELRNEAKLAIKLSHPNIVRTKKEKKIQGSRFKVGR